MAMRHIAAVSWAPLSGMGSVALSVELVRTGRTETAATEDVAGSAAVELGATQSPSVRRVTTSTGTRVRE
jgi:hypothetical protein